MCVRGWVWWRMGRVYVCERLGVVEDEGGCMCVRGWVWWRMRHDGTRGVVGEGIAGKG